MLTETIYAKLPVFMQNILCSLYGLKEARTRFSNSFYGHLENYKKSEFSSQEDIRKLKDEAFVALIKHAYNTVPYYQKLFEENALKVDQFQTIEDIKQLPILSKELLRFSMNDLISSHYNKRDLIEVHTSGTTGKALIFFKTKETIAKQWAIWFRHRSRFGVKVGDLHVNFTGKKVVPINQKKPPYWRFNKPMNQYLLNMQHITPEKIGSIVRFLNTIKPVYYSGYPSILAEVARLALQNNLVLMPQARPKYIFPGAENTLDYQKDALELWTGATITDQYGLSEGCCNTSRCEHGYYHEDYEFGHIGCLNPEVLPDGKIRGRMIGTTFSNFAMPLLQYETGDVAIWMPKGFKCPCGRQSSVIESIEGRIDDVIELVDGRKMMRFDYLFKGTETIKEVQVCQYKKGEVVIKLVVRDNHKPETDEQLRLNFKQWICPETALEIEHVESIEKSVSGKFRAVKSYL